MQKNIFLLFTSLFLISCGQIEIKQKELELKKKEPTLNERELNIEENDRNNFKTIPINESAEVNFKSYTPCTFSVSLPSDFKLQPMYDDKSPDYCDYSAKTKNGFVLIEFHSLLRARFSFSNIKDGESEIKNLYRTAISDSQIDIIPN